MVTQKNAKTASIKIIIVSHSGEIGGAELALLDMLDFLIGQMPIELHFIMPWDNGGLDVKLKKRGWDYSIVPYTVWSLAKPLKHIEDIYRENQKNISAVEGIIKVIDDIQPDIVWSNSVVCPWGAIAAAQRPVHHMWYVHEYGDVGLNLEFEQGRDKSLSDVGWLSDLVIANSLTIKAHLSNYIAKSKIYTAYIPYDTKKVASLTKQKSENIFGANNDLKLILLGRIVTTKGQIDAVKAVGELKKRGVRVELCLVGTAKHDQYYGKTVQSTIRELGIKDRIIFIDHSPNPFPYIKAADVGLTCSYHEAFGRTTFEYMLLGKAVIGTTDTGATKELVRDGINGFGYHFGDSVTLADYIEVYSKDRRLLKQHSANAAEVVDEILNGPNSPKHLAKLLTQLASKKPKQKLPNITEKLMDFATVSENFRLTYGKKANPQSYSKFRRVYNSKPFRPAKAIIKPLRQARAHKKVSKP